MEEIFNPKISVFKNLFDKSTSFNLTLGEVANRIHKGNPNLITTINQIRDKETEKDKKDSLKKSLMAIMFNGVFSERTDAGLIEHSGMCIFDFDKYPNDKVMNKERERLIKDPFTLMVFTSPSGNGLKSLIKIPQSNKEDHIRRFAAYKDYIKSDYFDVKNSNVSRVCFESYDPDIYLNQSSEIFDKIEQDKGYTLVEKVPLIPLRDENEIINRIMNFNRSSDFSEGNRNNYILNIASHFCEYGVDEFSAENYITNNFCDDDFKKLEASKAVKSAYKMRQFESKYFEDYSKLEMTANKIKRGVSDSQIIEQLNVSKKIIEEVKAEVIKGKDIFWEIIENAKGKKTVIVEPYKLMSYLSEQGFYKYYPDGASEPVIIKIESNKVNLSSSSIIIDYVKNVLIKEDLIEVYNFCFKNQNVFSDKSLVWLLSIDLNMLEDTKTTSYIPFSNGVVKVKKDNIEMIPYLDINGYIWEKQIIPREFNYKEDYSNDFQDFISKISDSSPQRIESLETTIGYLSQTFKDKTDQKAIIFNDEEINDNPNGGSGKSLVLTALSYFRRLIKIDGKAFDPNKSDFVYQRVNLDTQILAFDDVKRKFDFEGLFSLITEGITVNRKNKDEIFIPFDRSPKIVITTNYVINGAGSSHDRRRHEIEFNQYFNESRTPLDEYGKLLFDEWNDEEFNRFDNYLINCIQLFYKKGLVRNESINADVKRFIQSTSKDFYDFVTDEKPKENTRIYNQSFLSLFTGEYKSYDNLNAKTILKWIGEYSKLTKLELEKGRDSLGRYFILKSDNQEEIKLNEDPF